MSIFVPKDRPDGKLVQSVKTQKDSGYLDEWARIDHVHDIDAELLDLLTSSTDTNMIDNPEFKLFQRTLPITGAGFGFDRWRVALTGAAVYSHAVGTSWPTGVQTSGLYTVTTADAAIAAGDVAALVHSVEGYISAKALFGSTVAKPITISFWARASLAGVYCVAIRNSGATRSYVKEYTLVADTWTKVVLTFPGCTDGTWEIGTSAGLAISWAWSSGTTFQTTANTWAVGNFLATSNQVNLSATLANNFSITQVQVTVGNFDPPFKQKDHIADLERCRRYYQLFSVAAGAQMLSGPGQCFSATTGVIHVPFTTPFRVAPTFTANTAAATFAVWNAASALVALTVIAGLQSDIRMGSITITTAAGLVAGNSTFLFSSAGNAASFQYSAEI